MASFDIIQAEYAATAVRRDQYPTNNLPEVAFLGRSNVGKSSLINSLCHCFLILLPQCLKQLS